MSVRPLHIAVDASRTTVAQRTGTENYALRLLQHLITRHSPHQFHYYFRDAVPDELFAVSTQLQQHVIRWPRMWTHMRFAVELWRTRPDVTFVPAHTLPRIFPGKAVVTVHDLGYLKFPEAHPDDDRRYLDWTTRFSANRATLILVDSEATAADLAAFYEVSPEKIRVVYPGYDQNLRRVDDEQQIASTKARYGIDGNYFFFLGTLQPRKNIARLVSAFDQWQQSSNHPMTLVLGGKAGWLYDDAWTRDVPNVMITGYVDDEDIAALYSGTTAFLFPSLYEGFGIPVLEAMACGTPVLCSNTSSLPEIVGDAAILVDPESVTAIADGISRLMASSDRRAAMVGKGYKRLTWFSWDKAAEQTLAVLEAAARS